MGFFGGFKKIRVDIYLNNIEHTWLIIVSLFFSIHNYNADARPR